MALGHKSGGRKAGTPNRKTQDISALLDSLGCDPIEGMARIAMNKVHTPELRGRMYAELAQYVYPKRKSVEVSGDQDAPLGPTKVEIVIVPTPSEEQIQKHVGPNRYHP
jgi:hypothetical protein